MMCDETLNARSAVASMSESVDAARRTLWEIETYRLSGMKLSPDQEVYADDLGLMLSRQLERLGRQLPALLELANLPKTREDFLASWGEVSGSLGTTDVFATDIDVSLVSKPLELIEEIVRVLLDASGQATVDDPGTAAHLRTLEYVLRSTPQILRARRITPTKEAHIHGALRDHLKSTFPGYSKGVPLPKAVKSFVPDGAIPSLRVQLEYKFADSQEEVATALSGVMEDLSGYGGSEDWIRFYSLVYQTEPFVNEEQFSTSLGLTGNAGRWRAIVVTGHGKRPTSTGEDAE